VEVLQAPAVLVAEAVLLDLKDQGVQVDPQVAVDLLDLLDLVALL
jgi:hypothetical protein